MARSQISTSKNGEIHLWELLSWLHLFASSYWINTYYVLKYNLCLLDVFPCAGRGKFIKRLIKRIFGSCKKVEMVLRTIKKPHMTS